MITPLENNPIRHIQRIKAKLLESIGYLQDDVGKTTEAKAGALFESSLKVLASLVRAYDDYERNGQRASRTELMASLPKRRAAPVSRR